MNLSAVEKIFYDNHESFIAISPNCIPKVTEQPVATMMGGQSSLGKSTLRKEHKKER